jgi:hypothetical protein
MFNVCAHVILPDTAKFCQCEERLTDSKDEKQPKDDETWETSVRGNEPRGKVVEYTKPDNDHICYNIRLVSVIVTLESVQAINKMNIRNIT